MLAYFFRGTVNSGYIPDSLKQAFIIPIHKGGPKCQPEEYRPIFLTSHLMKTGERVIRRELVGYLEFYKKMNPNQHGSRANRSTLSQLLIHYDEVIKALENGENVDTVYLDFKTKWTMEY